MIYQLDASLNEAKTKINQLHGLLKRNYISIRNIEQQPNILQNPNIKLLGPNVSIKGSEPLMFKISEDQSAIRIPVTGVYQINMKAKFSANSPGSRDPQIHLMKASHPSSIVIDTICPFHSDSSYNKICILHDFVPFQKDDLMFFRFDVSTVISVSMDLSIILMGADDA